jgi:hypothetical protein
VVFRGKSSIHNAARDLPHERDDAEGGPDKQ